MAVSDRSSSNAMHELSLLGSVLAAGGLPASLVALSDGWHVLADTYGDNLGSGYYQKLYLFPSLSVFFRL